MSPVGLLLGDRLMGLSLLVLLLLPVFPVAVLLAILWSTPLAVELAEVDSRQELLTQVVGVLGVLVVVLFCPGP